MAFYGYRLNRLVLRDGRVEVWPYASANYESGQYEGTLPSYCRITNRRTVHATSWHRCGYHAFKSLRALTADLAQERPRSLGDSVLFRCALWGRVVEHEFGYRAEYCRLVAMLPAVTGGCRWLRTGSGAIGYAPWDGHKWQPTVEPLDAAIPERWAAERGIEVIYMPIQILFRQDTDVELRRWLVEIREGEPHESW